MIEKDKWMSIGEIVAPQGLKGDIRIKPNSEFSERFTKPGKRWIQKANELPTEIKLKKGTLIPGEYTTASHASTSVSCSSYFRPVESCALLIRSNDVWTRKYKVVTLMTHAMVMEAVGTGCGQKPDERLGSSNSRTTEYIPISNERDLLHAVPIAVSRSVHGTGAAWMKAFRSQRPMQLSFASTRGDRADACIFSGFICVSAQSGSGSHSKKL